MPRMDAPDGVRAPPAHLAAWVGVAAVAVELLVSANLLTWLGVPYVTEGGNLALKFHPGTLLLVLASVLCWSDGLGWASLAGDTPLMTFLAGLGFCLLYLMCLTGPGHMIVLLDTFLPAGLLAMVLNRAAPTQLWLLRRTVQILVCVGAVLAIAETLAHRTLLPLYLNDQPYHPHQEEFRPTALYDHPLTGSVMTMLGFAVAPRRFWSGLAYGTLLCAALLSFGGRTAILAMLAVAISVKARHIGILVLHRDARATGALLGAAAALALGLAVVGVAIAAGMGDRVAGHLYWDSSAQVRLAQWQMLGWLDTSQLLFGISRPDLLRVLTPLWLGYGVEVIENFWLLMFAAFGAVGFAVFVVSLAGLLVWCWRRAEPLGRWLLVATLLVASTSNSLGRKSTILVITVAALASSAARRPAGSGARVPARPRLIAATVAPV